MKTWTIFIWTLILTSPILYGAVEPLAVTLNDLPDEPLSQIITHLNYTDLGRLSCTAKRFAALFHNDLIKQKKDSQLLRAWKKPATMVIKDRNIALTTNGAITICPDGKLIASAEEQGFSLRDARTGEKVSDVFARGEKCDSLRFFNPEPSILQLIEVTLRHIRIWNILKIEKSEKYRATVQDLRDIPPHGIKTAVTFSPHKKITAFSLYDGTVHIWTKDMHKVSTPSESHCPTALAFSSDEKILAIGSIRGSVHIWNWETNEKIKLPAVNDRFEGHAVATSVVFSPDQKYVAATFRGIGEYKGYAVWDLRNRRVVIKKVTGMDFFSAAFSPDSKLIAMGPDHGQIPLICIENCDPVNHLPEVDYGQYPVFSPDGKSIAVLTFLGFFALFRVTSRDAQ